MSGFVKIDEKWPDVRTTIFRNIEGGVRRAALAVEQQIAYNITGKGLVDTGNYRRSWTTEVDGTQAQIGSPVEYGPYLEYGYTQKAGQVFPLMSRGRPVMEGGRQAFRRTTGKMIAARPHVVPAAVAIASRIVSYFDRLDRK